MPLIVPIENLQPGMKVAGDVLGDGGQLLLARGARLSHQRIESLRRYGILSIKVLLPSDEEEADEALVPSNIALKVRRQIREIYDFARSKKALPEEVLYEVTEEITSIIEGIFSASNLVFSDMKHLANYDEYTYEHSWMATLFSLALMRVAAEEGLVVYPDFQTRLDLGIGALLHDIGKMRILPEILNKPGPLSAEEWEIMKMHPQWGWEMVRKNPTIMPLARGIVLHHHQRWDGTGYGPASGILLKGGEIPEVVRLVTIADTYDALISDRPYRPAFLPAEALEILKEEAGTKLDPNLAPLMSEIAVDYPTGCVVISRDGAIVNVNAPSRRGEPIRGLVIGSISERSWALVGKEAEIPRSSIRCGGTSLDNLARRLKRRPEEVSSIAQIDCNLSLKALPPWQKLLERALKPLIQG